MTDSGQFFWSLAKVLIVVNHLELFEILRKQCRFKMKNPVFLEMYITRFSGFSHFGKVLERGEESTGP
jgi:hypothetical protein